MRVKNDIGLFTCLVRLRNSPEFAPFMQLLESAEKEVIDNLVSANTDRDMHILQGEIRFIRELKNLIDESQRLASR